MLKSYILIADCEELPLRMSLLNMTNNVQIKSVATSCMWHTNYILGQDHNQMFDICVKEYEVSVAWKFFVSRNII